MSETVFINCRPHNLSDYTQYVYKRNEKEYSISSGMLISLFNIYGYCVDPTSTISLSRDNINRLKYLAHSVNDIKLCDVINKLTQNDVQLDRILNAESNKYNGLSFNEKNQIKKVFKDLLDVAMYCVGWKGYNEPYPNYPKEIKDIVRLELSLHPKIQRLKFNPSYFSIKNLPIVTGVIHEEYTIDSALQELSGNICSTVAISIIKTVHHYMKYLCRTALPTLEPFIANVNR